MGMTTVQFHARKTQDGKEFICDRCSGPVVRKPGASDSKDDLPHVMFCQSCGLVVGEWSLKKEREQFLDEMPTL